MSTSEFQHHVAGHRQQLYWFALSLTRDRERALDLTQESMLRALIHREQFRSDTNLKAWLTTIVRNTFINEHRRQRRTVDVLANVQHTRLEHARSGSAATSESSMRMAEIDQALQRLDDIFRTPFQMHHQGFKYQEIADALAVPVGTVKSRIHQARSRLMALLTDREDQMAMA